MLARLADAKNHLEAAITGYRKALAIDAGLAEAHAARGFALWLMGHEDQACSGPLMWPNGPVAALCAAGAPLPPWANGQ